MPRKFDLKKAKKTDEILGESLDALPDLGITKDNPYHGYAKYLQVSSIYNQSVPIKINEELIEIPVPPKSKRTSAITPKVKFVKNKGGTKRKKSRKTRKYRTRI
jgi:hypothetical protein